MVLTEDIFASILGGFPGLTGTARAARCACLDYAAEHAGMAMAIREEVADGPVMRCDVPQYVRAK